MSAIRLQNPRRAGWPNGVEAAYGNEIFVSPPVEGWVFVVGSTLPGVGDENHPDEITPLVKRLSRELDTTVQSFDTHRVVEYHAWILAKRGDIVRGYAYLGEAGTTLVDVGEKTPEEIELGLAFFDERSPEAQDDQYWERTDLTYPNEETVMAVARAWSVDPQTLGDIDTEIGEGWLGKLP
jgi:hypothetical protein